MENNLTEEQQQAIQKAVENKRTILCRQQDIINVNTAIIARTEALNIAVELLNTLFNTVFVGDLKLSEEQQAVLQETISKISHQTEQLNLAMLKTIGFDVETKNS